MSTCCGPTVVVLFGGATYISFGRCAQFLWLGHLQVQVVARIREGGYIPSQRNEPAAL